MSNSIDITPSPRILRMLGQIDFSAIQCLCELIDNSIDAFADSAQASSSSPEIIVRVPKIERLTETSEILISDNGAGMDIDQLNRSLKAGFSSNNPVDKMGLFGMGFNIATARLGLKVLSRGVDITAGGVNVRVGVVTVADELDAVKIDGDSYEGNFILDSYCLSFKLYLLLSLS